MDTTALNNIDDDIEEVRKQIDEANTSWERNNLMEEAEELLAARADIINDIMHQKPTNQDLLDHLDAIDFHGDFDGMTEAEKDAIINPKHYKIVPSGNYPDGIEYTGLCRLIMADKPLTGFQAHILGQVIKYTCRLGGKDAAAQDAKKLAWYAQYLADDLNGNERP